MLTLKAESANHVILFSRWCAFTQQRRDGETYKFSVYKSKGRIAEIYLEFWISSGCSEEELGKTLDIMNGF